MQLLPDLPLPDAAVAQLVAYQAEIDHRGTFAERVARGKELFKAHNRRGNTTFDSVKKVLTEMCSGARRCAYCEDSAADEVEHVYPKHFYPERVFVWRNYIYACGPAPGPRVAASRCSPPVQVQRSSSCDPHTRHHHRRPVFRA